MNYELRLKSIILYSLFIILFLFRLQTVGGISKPEPDPFLEDLAANFVSYREALAARVADLLPEPQAALLSGILLGVKSDLPRELKTTLQNTSTIHIVVVSGQNLTLLAGFLMSLTPVLGRKKTISLTMVGIIFYSLLTGLQIPVLRAALMVGFGFLAVILGKERTSWWILILTGYLMLLYNPNWLLSISFQLSFLATIGVVVVAPIVMPYFSKLPDIIKQDLVVSLAAQLLTIPIIAINFHQLSLYGIIVNSLILWLVSPVMILGILLLVVSFIIPPLAVLISLLPTALLTYFLDIVNFFGNLPMSNIYVGKISLLFWLGYYLWLGSLVWSLYKKQVYNKSYD